MTRTAARTFQALATAALLAASAAQLRAEEPGAADESPSHSRSVTKTYTGPDGKQVTVEKSGTVTKNGDGSFQYDGERTVTGPNGESRTRETTGGGKLTKNEDGSTSFEGSHTATNDQGKSRTVTNSGTVTPTENGKTWTRERGVENSAGGKRESTTTGSATRNGDGSGTWSSHTDHEGTSARGKAWGGTTDREGSWQRGKDGVKTRATTTRTRKAR